MKQLPVLLLALASAATLQAQETLKFKEPAKNPDLEGEVVGLSFKSIEIVTKGVKQTIDAQLVAEIVPAASRKTPDYLKGEEALANGNPSAAAERFERVATDPRAPEALRQLASIQIVRCAAAKGDHAAVVQAAQVLRARKEDSFFLNESFTWEIKADIALGNGLGATGALRAFRAVCPASPDLVFLEATVAESENNWKEALAIYRRYLQAPAYFVPAALGEMRCLTAQADWPGLGAVADGHLKNAMGKRDFSTRVLIAAYTAKGDVDLNGGKAKDALLNYLQGAISLNKGETSPENETALARAALACAKLFTAEKDPPKKARYRTQAQEMRAELLKLYPKTRYKADIDNSVQNLR